MRLWSAQIVLCLTLAGCYHAPGIGPAPPGNDLTAAAAAAFPGLAKRYAAIDKEAAGQEFKNHAELFDWLKERRHAALEHGFGEVSKAFDARFEKDGDNLKWDAAKAKQALADEAKGFGK